MRKLLAFAAFSLVAVAANAQCPNYGGGMNNWGSYGRPYGRPTYQGSYYSNYNYGRPMYSNRGWNSNVSYDQGYSSIPSTSVSYDQGYSSIPSEGVTYDQGFATSSSQGVIYGQPSFQGAYSNQYPGSSYYVENENPAMRSNRVSNWRSSQYSQDNTYSNQVNPSYATDYNTNMPSSASSSSYQNYNTNPNPNMNYSNRSFQSSNAQENIGTTNAAMPSNTNPYNPNSR